MTDKYSWQIRIQMFFARPSPTPLTPLQAYGRRHRLEASRRETESAAPDRARQEV